MFQQPDAGHPAGYLLPFHLDTRATSAANIPSTSHDWQVQHDAWNGGRMDGWMAAHRGADGVHAPYVMGYYTRADLPVQFALAEAFTVCDALARVGARADVAQPHDVDDRHGRPGGPRRRPLPRQRRAARRASAGPPTPERLTRAGVSWRVYQQDDTFGCNVLEQFAAFRRSRRGSALAVDGLAARSEFAFESDAMTDRLPTVSWVVCTSTTSEHPSHRPSDGADFIASKIDAIAANPDVWAKTAVILTYDENDGLFDHVAPPTPPPGTPGEFVTWTSPGGTPATACRWGRLPGARRRHLAVDGGRLGELRAVRPHVGAAVPGAGHRGGGAEHLGVAAAHVRRSDLGVPVRRRPGARSAHGAARAGGDPAVGQRVGHLAATRLPPPRLPGAEQFPPTQETGTRPRV